MVSGKDNQSKETNKIAKGNDDISMQEREASRQLRKWGDMALDMLKLGNKPLFNKLLQDNELLPFLKDIEDECFEQNYILREQMRPESTDDWLTNWQNLERVSSQIEEILISEVIEPRVLREVD